MGRRILLLVAALLLAAIGTGVLFLYVQDARNGSGSDGDTVRVLVPERPLAAGETIADDTPLTDIPYPRARAANLITRRGQVLGKATSRQLPANVPLTTDGFGDAGPKMAIAFEFDAAARGGGELKANDTVAAWVTKDENGRARVVLPRVTVVKPPTAGAADPNPDIVILSVTEGEAAQLFNARNTGELYLTLATP